MTKRRNPGWPAAVLLAAFGGAWLLGGQAARAAACPGLAEIAPAIRPLSAVPAQRLAALSRGVNLTTLFAPDATAQRVHTDISELAHWGFRHVRIPVDPASVIQPDKTRRDSYMARLDQGICATLTGGLAVIVDLHDGHALKLRDGIDEGVVDSLAAAWDELAQRYRTLPADRVFFEVANEPDMGDTVRWSAIQEKLLARIRAVAPASTVILTASRLSTFWALTQSQPVADGNAVYNFHFYTPMLFTHQAADWLKPSYKSVHGLAFPATPSNVTSVSAGAEAGLRPGVEKYGQDYADSSAITRQLDKAIAWGRMHKVPLVVTEFGVRRAAPDASRAQWFEDVVSDLDNAMVGWTIWEYDGGFGIKPDLDAGCHGKSSVPAALGLCP